MKFFLSMLLALMVQSILVQGEELKGSNAPKVYNSANGEKLTVLEVNGSKQILAKFEGVGGEWEGLTQLWMLDGNDGEKMDAYAETKRGSKKQRYVYMAFRNAAWTIYPPDKFREGLTLKYSAKDSKEVTASDLIGGYKSSVDSIQKK